jgi:NAD(P)H dehydrogenase (quinone)
MDHYGIANAVSRALGIPVTYEPVSIEHFADILASAGRSPHFVQHISSVALDYQNGIFSGTNNLIEVIGNRTPLTVEEFVTSRKDAFQRNGPLYEPATPGH